MSDTDPADDEHASNPPRTTAPMSSFDSGAVVLGAGIALVGLAIVFVIPLLVTGV